MPCRQVAAAREPFGPFALRFAKTLASGLIPGFMAGFVAFGLGSRIAMRVMAVTSGPAAQGITTDAGEIVGRITLEGSMFLVLAGTLIGGLGGLVYLAIKPWLPKKPVQKTAVFAILMLAVAGRPLVQPDNIDFSILSPPLLAVAMLAALPILFGSMYIPLHERLAPWIMRERSLWPTIFLLVPALLPALMTGPGGLILPVALLIGWALNGTAAPTSKANVLVVGRVVLTVLTVGGITLLADSINTIF